ncbi:hypothetical protein [Lacrimispora amygdalina]|uniref:hypothetical protein n=1 Tax=Lacrimispora amygdalina TaxID=253257 RepID=UPI000BE26330|nr:hypothetical protein [Lacrimispora amygdalina]
MFGKLRSQFKPYKDWFFMAYFLPLAGCVAMGISSDHIIYKLCFLLGLVFLAVKVWLTDYEKYEIIIMMLFIALLGYVFFRTREKSLIITTITIFGCKDVDTRRALKYTLFVYIIGVTVRMGLSWLKILPGKYFTASKSGIRQIIYDFGFSNPNSAYNHILMISLMVVAVYKNKIKWYHYILMSFAMVAFYNMFFSRTGILTYIILCVFLLMLFTVNSNKVRKVLGLLYLFIPLCIASLSCVFLLMYRKHFAYLDNLNQYLTRRIELSYNAVCVSGINFFGSIDKSWKQQYYVDNAYINLLINFGVLIFIICILSYLVSAFYYWKNQEYYVLILLATMSIYAFMEYSPVNITWNPILLYIADGIFKTYRTQNVISHYD